MVEKRSATDSLIEASMLQTHSIRDLRETIAQSNQQLSDRIDDMGNRMEQANQRLSDRIDQMGERLERSIDQVGHKIDDLAVQVGTLSESITRLERTVDRQYTTAELQSQNVAELIRTVRELAIARG
jgi:chromosome segregation ATPase